MIRLPRRTTERLELRPVSWGEVAALHRQWCEPEVFEYLFDGSPPSLELAQSIVGEAISAGEKDGIGVWVVIERDTGRLLGMVGLRSIADDLTALAPAGEIELLYVLSRAAWGRGIAVEASREILAWAHHERGLARVFARTDAPNLRSQATMERLGLRVVQRATSGVHGETVVAESRATPSSCGLGSGRGGGPRGGRSSGARAT